MEIRLSSIRMIQNILYIKAYRFILYTLYRHNCVPRYIPDFKTKLHDYLYHQDLGEKNSVCKIAFNYVCPQNVAYIAVKKIKKMIILVLSVIRCLVMIRCDRWRCSRGCPTKWHYFCFFFLIKQGQMEPHFLP